MTSIMSCLIREPSLACCFSIVLESLGLVVEPLNGPAPLLAIAMDRHRQETYYTLLFMRRRLY